MPNKKELIARLGLSAIECVYVLIGILTALAALNLGGNKVGTKGVIGFLAVQPLGKILLLLLAIGLFGYVFWRMYQTFLDSRRLRTGYNALFTRAGYFTGAIFYGFWTFVIETIFWKRL